MNNVLKVCDVKKIYGSKSNATNALDGVSFDVKEEEFTGIMGASGSGKTTLLNCIATIDSVTSGKIYINGDNITSLKSKQLSKFRRETLGFIFQDFSLIDSLTIFENIALSLTITSSDYKKIEPRVNKIAKSLNIDEILEKFPYQISGGQKQRVACARALINSPSLILADEPTGSLDSKSSKLLLETFESMNNDFKATILMVTHDPFAASYCKRILFIKDGKIFNEIHREGKTRKQFFDEIISSLSSLGGEGHAF